MNEIEKKPTHICNTISKWTEYPKSSECGTSKHTTPIFKYLCTCVCVRMCTYACMKNTNTVDLLLAFICCNFFRSSSHWIISFVIYIRLCPYHVGTRKLSTYTLAKSSHFNSLSLSPLSHSCTLESLSIWIVFIRFNFVLNTFSHFFCTQTILEWKLNFEIPSFYLS